MIIKFKVVRGLNNADKEDLLTWDDGRTRGHEYKLKKTSCLHNIKKFSFPNRCINTWNDLDEEVVCERNNYNFKTKLDKSRYGDWTICA